MPLSSRSTAETLARSSPRFEAHPSQSDGGQGRDDEGPAPEGDAAEPLQNDGSEPGADGESQPPRHRVEAHVLAAAIGGYEQVLITAAVLEDVPASLAQRIVHIEAGRVVDAGAIEAEPGSDPEPEPEPTASAPEPQPEASGV